MAEYSALTPVPKISVVIPSFNQGRFLKETLGSLISEQYPDLEIIVIDGGSKDESVDVIRSHEKYIKFWVSEPDAGQTDALIKGFSVATGDVFFWLCSDDQILPGTLRLIGEIFAHDKSQDMVYGDTDYLYPDGSRVPKPRISYHFRTMLWAFNIIAQPSCFFSAKIYRRVGGLDPSFQYAMDYDLFLRFGPQVRWTQVKRSLSLYRIHSSSKTVNDLPKFMEEWARVRSKIHGPLNPGLAKILWVLYTIRVVLRFYLERGILKIRYDRRKYAV